MFIFKRDISDCDKYYYKMFEDLFNCKCRFGLRITLEAIRDYYKIEVENMKYERRNSR
jgi:hypothetical protein